MNLYPAGFGKFSPDVSLATGRNGSAHFGANVRTKWVAEGASKQHNMERVIGPSGGSMTWNGSGRGFSLSLFFLRFIFI